MEKVLAYKICFNSYTLLQQPPGQGYERDAKLHLQLFPSDTSVNSAVRWLCLPFTPELAESLREIHHLLPYCVASNIRSYLLFNF